MNSAWEARWAAKLTRRISLYPVLASLLLLALLENLVWVLVLELPGAGHFWLSMLVVLGLLLGWLMARSRLGGFAAGFIGLAAMASIILFRFGAFASALSDLLGHLPRVLARALQTEQAAALWELVPYLAGVWNSLSLPYIRLFRWLQAQGNPEVIPDPVVTAMLASVVVFALSLSAAWAIRRKHQPLAAILPMDFLLAVILYFGQAGQFFLILQLSASLLLVALVNFSAREADWESHGVECAEDVRFDLTWTAVALVLVISLAAWLAPSLSISRIQEISRQIFGERASQAARLAESIGLEPKPAPFNPFQGLMSPGLPRSHLLGAGPELSKKLVMAIQVQDISAAPAREIESGVPSYYWRGLAYDIYTGRGWRSSGIRRVGYRAGETNPAEPMAAAAQARQRIRLLGETEPEEGEILFAAGIPISADQDREIAWRSDWDALGQTGGQLEYEIVSVINVAGEEALRQAGEAYPAWVRERYLKLPRSVPDRVRALAIDLTAAEPTAYDRAEAIETYLRQIPYSLDVPLPPVNRDVSDYFLFDLKRGFCDYSATAMVVLARAAGLPARYVMGYATGRYNGSTQQYLVTEAEAHSWVEVFFPEYGWVIFEPTGSRPAIQRGAAGVAPVQTPAVSPTESGYQPPFQPGNLPWRMILIGGLLGAASLALMSLTASRLWTSALRPAAAVRAIYRQLRRRGAGLEIPPQPGQTPHEFSAEMAGRLKSIGQITGLGTTLEAGISDLGQLTDVYVAAAYGPNPPQAQDKEKALRAWDRLRWRLWLARLLKRLRWKRYNRRNIV